MSQAQADAIHDRYRKNFAGRSRATRDLAQLDALITESERLLAVTSGAESATVSERLALYRGERGEIAAIQNGGPAVLAAWNAVEWSELGFNRYRRHFAGQNRTTRDLGLLGEMAAEERKNLAAFPAATDERLTARKAQLEANLKLFEAELKAIPDARAQQAPNEQARALATAANAQFEYWRRFFDGKPRVTRRPALLERMIDTLENVRSRMIAVREMGVNSDAHAANITKVTERIAHFRGELEKITSARAQVGGAELARRLGDEANAVFAAYRTEYSGKPRTAADPARLSNLNDDLQEIARVMRLLSDERPLEQNTKNLGIVLDHLKMTEREHAAIVEARGKK